MVADMRNRPEDLLNVGSEEKGFGGVPSPTHRLGGFPLYRPRLRLQPAQK